MVLEIDAESGVRRVADPDDRVPEETPSCVDVPLRVFVYLVLVAAVAGSTLYMLLKALTTMDETLDTVRATCPRETYDDKKEDHLRIMRDLIIVAAVFVGMSCTAGLFAGCFPREHIGGCEFFVWITTLTVSIGCVMAVIIGSTGSTIYCAKDWYNEHGYAINPIKVGQGSFAIMSGVSSVLLLLALAIFNFDRCTQSEY